ncbi:MAG: hypothetical protein JO102_05675, partial [Elusimicrobia bacterium]|nr:hypothetical protein [Elusimicrobiota bacterium]
LWALASGYGSGFVKNIVVGNGTTDIGTLTLQAGKTISGGLFRADGTRPNSQDLGALVAVRNGFEEILVGQLSEDAENNVTGYKISGFQQDKAYTILAFDKGDKALVLADNLIVNNDTTRDLTLIGKSPSVLTTYSKNSDGTLTIQFEFTDPLRNSAIDLDGNGTPDDSDPAHVIALKNSSGTITYPSDWLSFDRRRARITYAPAAGELRFTLTVTAVFDTINAGTGTNFAKKVDFQYFLGIGRQKQKTISNAGGGSVGLDEDTSEFTAQAGTFGSTIDSDVDVVFRVADTIQDLTSSAGQAPISKAMTMANKIGLAAYPPEMSSAIQKAKTAEVNPFSSFYDIFLPAGVSHFFPEGHEAKLCVAYDGSAQDPYSLNVYYYNSGTNEYVLQSSNKTVDTDNQRICVSLSHASVFTVLNSSAAIISGAGYTGELNVLNFPNPFDLKPKTVTLQNPGSAAGTQQINGTMIKISVPPSLSGAFKIEVFSVTGEKVRTIDGNFPTGGAHYYFEWDGTNDHGSKVGSGTYVARLTIGGGNEKFFKMAVVK